MGLVIRRLSCNSAMIIMNSRGLVRHQWRGRGVRRFSTYGLTTPCTSRRLYALAAALFTRAGIASLFIVETFLRCDTGDGTQSDDSRIYHMLRLEGNHFYEVRARGGRYYGPTVT